MAISARLNRKEGRKFAFTLAVAFLVFAAIEWFRGRFVTASAFGGIALVLLAAGVLVPTHLGPLQRAWMRLGEVLGRFTTPIVMAAVYFVVITPIGAIMRAIGSDPLPARKPTDSLWIPRGDRRQSNLERQF